VAQLRRHGIAPAGDSGTYYQSFDFVSAVKLGPANALRFDGPGTAGSPAVDVDFRPFAFSTSASASGPLVFAGYGITAPDKNYDDYAGLDVTGKIVLVLRFAPDGENPRGEYARFTSFRAKERTAREKGAAGMLIITGPANDAQDDLVRLRHEPSGGSSGIPVLSVKRSVVEPLLRAAGIELKTIQDSIGARRVPRSVALPATRVTMTADVQKVMGHTANVVGVLAGTDPVHRNEVVVLGAHFDHLGFGGANSMVPDTVAIHNGADDNASGTAGLLELAELHGTSRTNRRTLLFTFFSGEELGTLGSQYYVAHPTYPLAGTVAMLNMDMIGRLDQRVLSVGGTGTSPVWPGLLNVHNADSTFVLKMNPDGFGPSDHASFYGRDIPVLFFFTGTHDDYHKPTDDWEKINYAGEESVVRYVDALVRDLDTLAQRPAFVRAQSTASASPGGDGRGFTVTLGIVPDFGESTTGMKISGVRPNGPAEKAGLHAGDVITKMGTKSILNIYDYMGVLGELKAGDQVEVQFLRDGKTLSATATMAKRN
jgi:hypothetical protein